MCRFIERQYATLCAQIPANSGTSFRACTLALEHRYITARNYKKKLYTTSFAKSTRLFSCFRSSEGFLQFLNDCSEIRTVTVVRGIVSITVIITY